MGCVSDVDIQYPHNAFHRKHETKRERESPPSARSHRMQQLGERSFVDALQGMQQQVCSVGCGRGPAGSATKLGIQGRKSCDETCRGMTVREVLSAVYPTARDRLMLSSSDELDALFRSLHFYYDHGCTFDGSRCAREPGVLLRWLYGSIFPCAPERPMDCVAAHSRFTSSWVQEHFTPLAGWLEVEHRKSGRWPNSISADGEGGATRHLSEHTDDSEGGMASTFLDAGLAGMWYTYRRGSGIFYRLGRSKLASGRTAMMADLLLEVASHPRLANAWPIIALRLRFNTSSSASKDSVLLRALSTGRRSCHSLGIRACRCGNALPSSWDDAMIWAARGLGYESLLFSATLLCRPGAPVPIAAYPQIADVRAIRPSWHREQEAGVFSMLDGVASGSDDVHLHRKNRASAQEWVEHMRRSGVLSLCDPAHVDDEALALPCNFSITTTALDCDGHVSSSWRTEWTQCGFADLTCGQRGAWASTSASTVSAPSASGISETAGTARPAPLRTPALAETLGGTGANDTSSSSQPVPTAESSLFEGTPPTLTSSAAADRTAVTTWPTATQGTPQRASIYRFTFTHLRPSGAQKYDGIQLSEIELYSEDGKLLPVQVALNPGGDRQNRLQSAPAAVDGSRATKWFDSSMASTGSSKLLLELTAGSEPVGSYRLVTGNDNPKRDPTDWVLHVRNAKAESWHLVDSAEGVMPPAERRCAYERRTVHYGLAGDAVDVRERRSTPIHLLAAAESTNP